MKPTRSLVAALYLLAALCVLPARADAQGFSSWAECAPGTACDAFRFFFAATGGMPLALTHLQLTFTSPGWTFTGVEYTGADPFSPAGFGSFAAALADGGVTATFDFASDLGWFEITAPFASYIDIAAAGTETGVFAWAATDLMGEALSGTGSVTGEPAAVPEPIALLLLGTGLAGIGAVRGRSRPASSVAE